MASSVDAVSGDTVRNMLSSYRNTGDTTGVAKKANAEGVEQTETPNESAMKRGGNDAAVYVDISSEAQRKFDASATDRNSATRVKQTAKS